MSEQETEVQLPTKEQLLGELEQQEEEQGDEQLDPIAQEAIKHGWNPEGVEGKRNLTAEEFMDRQKLYDDIRSLKKQLRSQKEAMDTLSQHHSKVRELEREKIIKELKEQKKLALEERDYDAVVEIDERLQKHSSEPKKEPETNNDAFIEWVADNSWYKTDPELQAAANAYGAGYYAANPEEDLKDVYKKVTERMQEMYPDKFGITENVARKSPPKVEGRKPSTSTKNKSRLSVSDLTEDERSIMRTLVKSGALTEEQYLKEYSELTAAGLK